MLDQPWPQPKSATRAGRPVSQPGHDVGHRRKPLGRQLLSEGRAVDLTLAVTEVAAVGLVRDAAAASVGGGQIRENPADARDHVREGRHVREVLAVDQHRGVVGGERVQALLRCGTGVLDVDQTGHGLLLEPLARVAGVDPGVPRKLAARHRAVLVERPVEAELGP
jgi:hypothetical protein